MKRLLPLLATALPLHAQSFYLSPGTTFVRGVVSVETSALTDPTWQGFAARTSTLLAVAGDNPLTSLPTLATSTGRPEVNVAPFVPYGLSANGRRAVQTAVANPGRCIAVMPHHPGRMFAIGNEGFNFNRLDGSVAADTLFDFTPAYPVPAIFVAGERDNLSGIIMPLGNFEWGRAHGAPWAFITEPDITHTGTPMPAALVTTLLESLINRRLPVANWPANQSPTLLPIDPTTGWLGDNVTKEIAPWATFTGDRDRATWLPDETCANVWAAYVIGHPWRIPAQPLVVPSSVDALTILDSANSTVHPANQAGGTSGEAAWKVCANLKVTDMPNVAAHGSRIDSLPASLVGSEWIRPNEASRNFTGATLATFTLTRDAEVHIAHDSRITTKPSWLTGWTDTGEDLVMNTGARRFSESLPMRLFKKSFTSGQTVTLGPNGGTSQSLMYLTILKSATTSTTDQVAIVTSDASAAEAALDAASFTVTRGTATTGEIIVNYTVSGSATSGDDFTALPGSVTIPDGANSASITLTPLDDALVEGLENVTLTLAAGSGYDIGSPASATTEILDNDGVSLPEVSISLNTATLVEGSGATTTFTISRTGATTTALPVSLSVTGTAGYGSDYPEYPLNLSIPIGSASATLVVGTLDDRDFEGAETLILAPVATTQYTVATPASATLTINDNDTATLIRLNGNTFVSHSTGDLKLDLYLPRNPAQPVPCVIFIFSGNWQNGAVSNGLTPATNIFGGGMACAVIDHRRSSQAAWPAHIHDVKAAIRWLRANAAEFGLDPTRFGAWGMGSGAHLASMAALSAGEPGLVVNTTATDTEGMVGSDFDQSERLQAFCAWYPYTDLLRLDNGTSTIDHNSANSPGGNLMGTPIQSVPERSASANPLLFVREDAPPALIMHGDVDTSVPFLQSEMLHDRLLRAGRKSLFCPMIGSGHGFANAEQLTAVNFFRHAFGLETVNQPPVATFTASTLSGTAPLTVDFDATGTADPDGTLRLTAWSFGDNSGASGLTASRTFTIPGTYRVTFCAQDNGRLNSNAHALITVLPPASENPPPIVTLTAPAANFTHLEPAALHLGANATAANGTTIATVEFFLDGQLAGRDLTAPYGLSLGGIGPGTRVLTARATDSTGATSTRPPVAVNILSARPEPIWITENHLTYLGLRHRRLPGLANRIHEVQGSTDLFDWPAVTTTPSVQTIGIVEEIETRDELSTEGLSQRFLRVASRRVTP